MKAIILILLCLSGISGNVLANTPGEVKIGGYLPEAALHGFSGDSRKLSEFRGKPLIINVWASWCGPCRAEMGSLERLSSRLGGKQFNIIGISTDDDASAALAFIKSEKLTFDNYLDSKVVLENMLGANTIPLTILVDAHGCVVKKVYGSQAWDSPTSLKLIEKTFSVNKPRCQQKR